MELQKILNSYISEGMSKEKAEAHTCIDIILQIISNSKYSQNITIKGGVLMYNLTDNIRRATTDLDFDLIHISIADDSICSFINNLNVNSEYKLKIISMIPLHHKDYQGKRLFLSISDASLTLSIKIDIGVHTYSDIIQDEIILNSKIDNNICVLSNPIEQIFVEKTFSLARIGPSSKRHKDIYDLNSIVSNKKTNVDTIFNIIALFLDSGKYPFKDLDDYCIRLLIVLSNAFYYDSCTKTLSKITDLSPTLMFNNIKEFVCKNLLKVDYFAFQSIFQTYKSQLLNDESIDNLKQIIKTKTT